MKGFEQFQINITETNKVKGGMDMSFQNGQPDVQYHFWDDVKEAVVDVAEDIFVELFDDGVVNIPPEYAQLYMTVRSWLT